MKPRFKYVPRGFDKTLCLIPGWGADFRIFRNLDLDYNYLYALDFSPRNFNQSLVDALWETRIEKISLFGWSMGAFLAKEFALDNLDKIDEIFFISMRPHYDALTLRTAEEKLKSNKKAFLYKAYLEGFGSRDDLARAWFKKNLLRDFCSEFKLDELLAGLDYLGSAFIRPPDLVKLGDFKVFHGSQDSTAPLVEVRELLSQQPKARLTVMEGVGHMPFLHPDFKEAFRNG
ncbi:MAG: alpha/beta hydrolase [Candidatus Omnitrophica bacterium]|nr:alpha/beta hydrolase [Candidatus Omnitrophota bacterium]